MRKLIASLIALAVLTVQAAANGLLIDPYRFAGALPPFAFVGCTENINNLSAFAFTDHAIGTASTERDLIIGIFGEDSANDFDVLSIDVAGTAAAMQVATSSGVRQVQAEIWTAHFEPGTTATISVTWTEAITSMEICVWSAYGLNSATATATDTAGNTTGADMSSSVTVNANGLAVGIFGYSGDDTFTISNMTGRPDSDGVDGTEMSFVGGDMVDAGAGTALSTTVDGSSNSGHGSGALAAFQ